MSDLADFLLARIAEDEESVNGRTRYLSPGGWRYLEQFGDFGDDERWMIEIPAARVLAECEAKRRMIERFADRVEVTHLGDAEKRHVPGAEDTGSLRLLALPYADHPDYREEWRA